MKLGSKISFGFNAVQAGQKSATVNAQPQLIVSPTSGKFTITAPVSKKLQIAVGENIMFLNNISSVEQAIVQRDEALVNWAAENGVDLDSREGQDAVLKEFTVWAIAKGVLLYDAKGNPVMASERYSKADKEAFIKRNAANFLDSMRDALIERVGNPDASDEELIAAITVDDVESPKYHALSGSKTSTSSTATGIGLQLSFTDTAIWNSMKADLGNDKENYTRYYKVLLDDAFETEVNNGYQNETIFAYPVEFGEDVELVREKKD